MPFDDLRQWIAALDRAGQLKRIQTEADPILEMAEITDRVSKSRDSKGVQGGPALLFQNLKGHPGSQVLINQFGSDARMKLALGVNSFDEIAGRIRMFMDVKSPQGFLDKLKMLPLLTEAGKFFPRTVATGPCKEVILREKFSLLDFPILQCWPKDGGRFITLPCVTTRDPRSGKRNLGMYRMQVYDERTTGMHWQRQKNAAEHAREHMRVAVGSGAEHVGTDSFVRPAGSESARAAVDIMARSSGGSVLAEGGRPSGKMEVAVAIGTEPAVTFSAIVPAPPEIEEYLIAGFLRGAPVELVKCETVDLEVPAASEIVLEGYVNLDELRSEGPFGDHTGFYSLEDLYPVFHVTCVTHRKDPIYATTIVGKPPQEDAYMGKAVERIFLPLMKLTIPELVDINLPIEGVFHNLDDRLDQEVVPGAGPQGNERHLVARPGHVHQVHRGGGRGCRCAGYWRRHAESFEPHRPGARHSIHAGPSGFARPRLAPAELRIENGHRRHAQVVQRRLHSTLARRDRDGYEDQGAGRQQVEGAGQRTRHGVIRKSLQGYCRSYRCSGSLSALDC